MRVEFINSSGGRMFVDESRVEEYKAAGFKLAANSKPKTTSDNAEEPAKRSRKKKED